MSMNKTMNMFIAFVAIFVIAFFAIGFTSTVVEPNSTTAAGQQYQNLTNTTDIASTGINATLLLLLVGMVIAAIVGAFQLSKRY